MHVLSPGIGKSAVSLDTTDASYGESESEVVLLETMDDAYGESARSREADGEHPHPMASGEMEQPQRRGGVEHRLQCRPRSRRIVTERGDHGGLWGRGGPGTAELRSASARDASWPRTTASRFG